MKKGFTVLELLLASAIAVIVLTGVVVSFSSSIRLMRIAMAQAELSLASRELRNRLLFHLEMPRSNEIKMGLLGATSNGSVLEGGSASNIIMDYPSVGSTLASISYHSMRLVFEDGSLVDERSSDRNGSRKWLRPNGFKLAERSMSDIVSVDYPGENARLLTLDMTMKAKSSKVELVNKQHIRIPIFGRAQE